MGKKILHILLLVSFLLTVLVPVTGIHIHKLASAVFLLLCIVHGIICRKKLGTKTWGILALVFVAFFSGLFGMIFDDVPAIMILHRIVSFGCIAFLAIHIFLFRKRI